jgi:hypothetical protein
LKDLRRYLVRNTLSWLQSHFHFRRPTYNCGCRRDILSCSVSVQQICGRRIPRVARRQDQPCGFSFGFCSQSALSGALAGAIIAIDMPATASSLRMFIENICSSKRARSSMQAGPLPTNDARRAHVQGLTDEFAKRRTASISKSFFG